MRPVDRQPLNPPNQACYGVPMHPVRHEHIIGTASIIVTAVFLVSLGRSFPVHAESTTTSASQPRAVTKTPEPAVLKTIMAAHWLLTAARSALPQLQLVHDEHLLVHDFTEDAFEGGALRLFLGH